MIAKAVTNRFFKAKFLSEKCELEHGLDGLYLLRAGREIVDCVWASISFA